jgi:hypothetical protein
MFVASCVQCTWANHALVHGMYRDLVGVRAQVDVSVRGEVKGGLGLSHDWARVSAHVATFRPPSQVCCKQKVVIHTQVSATIDYFEFGLCHGIPRKRSRYSEFLALSR